MAVLNLTGSCIPFHGVAGPFPYSYLDAYKTWVARGFHGQMGYMARFEDRESLEDLLPGVRSILAFGFPYPFDRRNALRRPVKDEFKIAHFAHGEDYHKHIRQVLKPIARELPGTSKIFCDSGRLMEKETAAHAGLGFVGKHSLLITTRHGSALMLGFSLTTAEIERTPVPEFAGCGNCERCLNVCPTGALTAPRVLDARKCISYNTMETITPTDAPSARWGYIYGCDLCQAACPYNARLSATGFGNTAPDLERVSPERLEANKAVVRDEHVRLVVAQDGMEFPLNPKLTEELFRLLEYLTGRFEWNGNTFVQESRPLPEGLQSSLRSFFNKTQLVVVTKPFAIDVR
jgi:epoxyqueuosine reductase QueG